MKKKFFILALTCIVSHVSTNIEVFLSDTVLSNFSDTAWLVFDAYTVEYIFGKYV